MVGGYRHTDSGSGKPGDADSDVGLLIKLCEHDERILSNGFESVVEIRTIAAEQHVVLEAIQGLLKEWLPKLAESAKDLKQRVDKLSDEAITKGLVNFEGIGQVDGMPVEVTLDGELHNGAIPF